MNDRQTKALWISGALSVCIVLGIAMSPRVASKVANAQEATSKLASPPLGVSGKAVLQDPNVPPPSFPPPPDELELPPAKQPAPVSLAPPASRTLDPDQDAEQFVAKTRKEAVDRIAALDKEAADLRAKLAKVEAASTRIKTAMGGLLEPVAQQVPQIVNGEPVLQPIPEGPKLPPVPADKPLNELPRY